MYLLFVDLINLSRCAAERATLALERDDESLSHREWSSAELWLSCAAKCYATKYDAAKCRAAKPAAPYAATPLAPATICASTPPTANRANQLSSQDLLILYHSLPSTANPVDLIVAYGNAVQSHLLSPVASSTRLHLSALDLPQLTYGALRRAGYTYTDEVSGLTDAQLLTVRNLGPKGVSLLREALSR
jgi:hypothetical protein